MAIEGLVRPFETKNRYSNDRISTVPPDPKGGKAHLCWGDVGTMPTPVPTGGDDVEMKDCDESNDELSGRSSDTIRIENPDDASQYIMVKRPKTIIFKHKNKKKSSWDEMSLVAASITAWEADMDAALFPMGHEEKCKLLMTLKPDSATTTN